MPLVQPDAQHLSSYIAALQRGWSADNLRPEAAQDELARIQADAPAFLASLEDRQALGPPVLLPDGTPVPRLPGFRRWWWDGEFCGSIGFRWQPGTTSLRPHCLGHIGYSVVPWKQGQGIAKAALAALLPEARALGMAFVDLTTNPENLASQRVILANGGELLGPFQAPAQFGLAPGLKYRIQLASP